MARHPTIVLTAFVVVPLGLTGAGWAHRAGLDVWNVPAAQTDLEVADARGRDLDEAREDAVRRTTASNRVIDRLVDGHLTLAAAAAELEVLHRDWVDYMAGLRTYYSGTTDRERFARSAVARVHVRLATDPSGRDEVIARLEAELASLFPAG
jgi:hypothetical protein